MEQQSLCYLLNFDLFEQVPEQELMGMAKSMHGKKVGRGQMIYSPHEEISSLFILKEGEVKLYHSHDGKTETFDTLSPGALFGNLSHVAAHPSHFSQANRDSLLCEMSIDDFVNILATKPELMMKFVKSMSERIRDYETRFKNNLYSAKLRIYGELKRLREKKNKSFFAPLFGHHVPLRMTHEEIAEITGLNRVTVTRSLKELKQDGLISIDANSGVIELHK